MTPIFDAGLRVSSLRALFVVVLLLSVPLAASGTVPAVPVSAIPVSTVVEAAGPAVAEPRPVSTDVLELAFNAASCAVRAGSVQSRIAADHIISCFKAGDFSSSFNLQYDKAIYGKMWREFKTSSLLQRLCRSERLFNWIVRKANQRADIHDLLIDALAHVDQKRRLTRPGFYFKLLFS
jgi:hypothetical protein